MPCSACEPAIIRVSDAFMAFCSPGLMAFFLLFVFKTFKANLVAETLLTLTSATSYVRLHIYKTKKAKFKRIVFLIINMTTVSLVQVLTQTTVHVYNCVSSTWTF